MARERNKNQETNEPPYFPNQKRPLGFWGFGKIWKRRSLCALISFWILLSCSNRRPRKEEGNIAAGDTKDNQKPTQRGTEIISEANGIISVHLWIALLGRKEDEPQI